MRRRITRTLLAVAAAGATITTLGFTAAAGASAATAQPTYTKGTTLATTEAAGYEASGRYFRYIQALITVPNIDPSTHFAADYIQLANGSLNLTGLAPTGDQYTRAGIEACTVWNKMPDGLAFPFGKKYLVRCNGFDGHQYYLTSAQDTPCGPIYKLKWSNYQTSCWAAFVAAWNGSLTGPYYIHDIPLDVNPGDGVFFSIYFDQAGNELHFVVNPPGTTGPTFYGKTQAYGPIFNHADALTDYTNSSGGPISLPPFAHQFRITQFLQGALTTYSGNRGSFAGPWTTSEVQATTNGNPYPVGHVVLSPSYLWGDGMLANGAVRWGDAFGVWARV